MTKEEIRTDNTETLKNALERIKKLEKENTELKEKLEILILNRFDEWFEITYQPVNCGNVPVPKVIPFKEHIRILKERDNQYAILLNEYNDLVESFNKLQKAYCDATGERYIEEVEEG